MYTYTCAYPGKDVPMCLSINDIHLCNRDIISVYISDTLSQALTTTPVKYPLITERAEAVLKSKTGWLDDTHIQAAHYLMKTEFEGENGLQV